MRVGENQDFAYSLDSLIARLDFARAQDLERLHRSRLRLVGSVLN